MRARHSQPLPRSVQLSGSSIELRLLCRERFANGNLASSQPRHLTLQIADSLAVARQGRSQDPFPGFGPFELGLGSLEPLLEIGGRWARSDQEAEQGRERGN